MVQLSIQTKTGCTFLVEAEEDDSVADLKQKIKKVKGFQPDTQQLVYARKSLDDDQAFESAVASMIKARESKMAKERVKAEEEATEAESPPETRQEKRERLKAEVDAMSVPYKGIVCLIVRVDKNPMGAMWKAREEKKAIEAVQKAADAAIDAEFAEVGDSPEEVAAKLDAAPVPSSTDPKDTDPKDADTAEGEKAATQHPQVRGAGPKPPQSVQSSKLLSRPSPLAKRLSTKVRRPKDISDLEWKFGSRFGWYAAKKGVALSVKGAYLSTLPHLGSQLELYLGLVPDPSWPPKTSAEGEPLTSPPSWTAPSICILDVSCCSIDAGGASLLAKAMAKIPTLQALDISNNKLMGRWSPSPSGGGGNLTTPSQTLAATSTAKKALTATSRSAKADAAKLAIPVWIADFAGAEELLLAIGVSALTDVNLAGNMLCTAALGTILGDGLRTSKKLETLNISNNEGSYNIVPPHSAPTKPMAAAPGATAPTTGAAAGEAKAAAAPVLAIPRLPGTDLMSFARPIADALKLNSTLKRLVFGNGRCTNIPRVLCKLPGPSLDYYNGEPVLYNGKLSTIVSQEGGVLELNLNATLDVTSTDIDISGRNMSTADALIAAAFLPRCTNMQKITFGGDRSGWIYKSRCKPYTGMASPDMFNVGKKVELDYRPCVVVRAIDALIGQDADKLQVQFPPVTVRMDTDHVDLRNLGLGVAGALIAAAVIPRCDQLQRVLFGGHTSGWVRRSRCSAFDDGGRAAAAIAAGDHEDPLHFNPAIQVGDSVTLDGKSCKVTEVSTNRELELRVQYPSWSLNALTKGDVTLCGRGMGAADALVLGAFLPKCKSMGKLDLASNMIGVPELPTGWVYRPDFATHQRYQHEATGKAQEELPKGVTQLGMIALADALELRLDGRISSPADAAEAEAKAREKAEKEAEDAKAEEERAKALAAETPKDKKAREAKEAKEAKEVAAKAKADEKNGTSAAAETAPAPAAPPAAASGGADLKLDLTGNGLGITGVIDGRAALKIVRGALGQLGVAATIVKHAPEPAAERVELLGRYLGGEVKAEELKKVSVQKRRMRGDLMAVQGEKGAGEWQGMQQRGGRDGKVTAEEIKQIETEWGQTDEVSTAVAITPAVPAVISTGGVEEQNGTKTALGDATAAAAAAS
jgi:hypothetical protein